MKPNRYNYNQKNTNVSTSTKTTIESKITQEDLKFLEELRNSKQRQVTIGARPLDAPKRDSNAIKLKIPAVPKLDKRNIEVKFHWTGLLSISFNGNISPENNNGWMFPQSMDARLIIALLLATDESVAYEYQMMLMHRCYLLCMTSPVFDAGLRTIVNKAIRMLAYNSSVLDNDSPTIKPLFDVLMHFQNIFVNPDHSYYWGVILELARTMDNSVREQNLNWILMCDGAPLNAIIDGGENSERLSEFLYYLMGFLMWRNSDCATYFEKFLWSPILDYGGIAQFTKRQKWWSEQN